MKKKILIVTERRADFSRFKPVLDLIKKDKSLRYELVVTGIHLLKQYGYSINEIKKGGYKISKTFKMYKYISNKKKDDGATMVYAMGVAISKLSLIVKEIKPDIILSGFDIAANFAVTVVGAHMNIPVAHIQGGEVSGTIDESLRHAMSKFSHYHLVSNLDAKNRLIKMGEVKKNIFIVGCPSIEALYNQKKISADYFKKKIGIDINKKYIIAIQHSVTTEAKEASKQITETIKAIDNFKMPTLFVCPNNDAGSTFIIKKIKHNKKIYYTPTLTLQEYKNLLEKCFALVGNSSSGIHEASSFLKPVINIGSRQNGRLRSKNIIDVSYSSTQILKYLKKLEKNNYYKKLVKNLKNPYEKPNTSLNILKAIKSIKFSTDVIQKRITY
ncbi:UDP-N-acetylglucosamine 2-epimerase [Candidatus Pelagibacter communis]|jgi:GDP/UDP-N,N'-diacetylbacillosamine 2-epimerase (hydrolysing)|uniref:UDP-N-acetylglucosamine 2-epimerase n=1 Tax=Pelagibacter ubique TaxID=198252 RepID=UPI0003665984|nr:UDP-N-acetylglucosamine 2-epimerase [Candidatus Pelagibacter ubique]